VTRLAPGDLVELRLEGGLGYVLATHAHPAYPEVLSVLPGLRAERPADPKTLAAEDGRRVLFPLGAALAAGALDGEVVARVDPRPAPFPTFRSPVRGRDGEPLYWWLWDGAGVRPADGPTDDIPVRKVLSRDAFLALFRG